MSRFRRVTCKPQVDCELANPESTCSLATFEHRLTRRCRRRRQARLSPPTSSRGCQQATRFDWRLCAMAACRLLFVVVSKSANNHDLHVSTNCMQRKLSVAIACEIGTQNRQNLFAMQRPSMTTMFYRHASRRHHAIHVVPVAT